MIDLAEFQRAIEVRCHDHAVSMESIGLEHPLWFGREVDQRQPRPLLVGRVLDLGEAMGGRGINANH
jgi:hypothetical protein